MNDQAATGCSSCGTDAPAKPASQMPPSIFNDVVGPVMRGPSSSHCAAALRIGRMALDLMRGKIASVRVEFDPDGSLATTHESQGSDMGLFGGLLGWEAADDRLPESDRFIAEAGIEIEIAIIPLENKHPNAYRLVLQGPGGSHHLTALSTGGGMIEVVEIDGIAVSMAGDFYELLHYNEQDELESTESREEAPESVAPNQICLSPVLPIRSRKDCRVPFLTTAEMLKGSVGTKNDLADLAIEYESARGNLSPEEVISRMAEIVSLLKNSVAQGLAGTEYDDRILGYQSGGFQDQMNAGGMFDAGLLNLMILQVTALMEVKSSMGVIVAAPTAGACGTFPGAVLAAAESLGADDEKTARAFLAGGLVGVFIAAASSFAAEVGGCQAETGSGASMAAGALVTLHGGTLEQSMTAASIALQNTFGMICDPVANRVEAPCLGKNIMGAANALSCANIALAGYDHLIPFDEVVAAHYAVGNLIPSELRCTALGGLSITPTSKAIEERLAQAKGGCGSACG